MKRIIFNLGLLMWAGCGLDEEKFQAQYAESICERAATCAEQDGQEYTDENREYCEESFHELIGEQYSGCTFDEKKAQACLDRVPDAPCASVLEGIDECNEVYQCGE